MKYDFDYYCGRDLKYPPRPVKPMLCKDHDPDTVKQYADDLEKYNVDYEEYKTARTEYGLQLNQRKEEFRNHLRGDYGLSQTQFDILWNHAWDHGHSSGLHEVYYWFNEFYEMAAKFAAASS